MRKTIRIFKIQVHNIFPSKQVKKHNKYGGVVPELASREHENSLDLMVRRTLDESNISLKEIDAFAATTGPGLLGGLLIGSNYAKALSLVNKKQCMHIFNLQNISLLECY